MTYLSVETCQLLQKLGIGCETGMWWKNGNHTQDKSLDQFSVIKEHEQMLLKKVCPAYSLPLLLASSEAMKKVFTSMEVCDDCGESFVIKKIKDVVQGVYKDSEDDIYCCSCGCDVDPTPILAYEYHSHRLLDLLLSNQPEEAERVLVEAINEMRREK
jgi:hypothetical protein